MNDIMQQKEIDGRDEVLFMKKLGLVFLILLFSTLAISLDSAGAANERWKAITGREGGERILYDPDNIIPSGPRMLRVWVMGFDQNHFPRKSLEEFDCTNKIIRDVEVIVERPNKPVAHTITPSDWSGVVRESPRGELFKILCR
jgi:hypothetical protein